jgi:hypothetical protein
MHAHPPMRPHRYTRPHTRPHACMHPHSHACSLPDPKPSSLTTSPPWQMNLPMSRKPTNKQRNVIHTSGSRSLPHSLTHSFTHSLTHSSTHLLTLSLTHALTTHSPTHTNAQSPTHSHIHARWQGTHAHTIPRYDPEEACALVRKHVPCCD